MTRLRIESAPEVTIFDEAFVVKAALGSNAAVNLAEFKNSSGTVIASVNAAR